MREKGGLKHVGAGDLALSGEVDGRRNTGAGGPQRRRHRGRSDRASTGFLRPDLDRPNETGLLRHRATLGPGGDLLVDGRPWHAADVARDVEAAAGAGARLVRSDADDRFDILPLLVVTDGMLSAVGYDRRRFRPNLVIGGVRGLSERQWEGGSCALARS